MAALSADRLQYPLLHQLLDKLCLDTKAAAELGLRTASVNIFNCMVSLTFSCDGSHYMRYDKFLAKGDTFWSGTAE